MAGAISTEATQGELVENHARLFSFISSYLLNIVILRTNRRKRNKTTAKKHPNTTSCQRPSTSRISLYFSLLIGYRMEALMSNHFHLKGGARGPRVPSHTLTGREPTGSKAEVHATEQRQLSEQWTPVVVSGRRLGIKLQEAVKRPWGGFWEQRDNHWKATVVVRHISINCGRRASFQATKHDQVEKLRDCWKGTFKAGVWVCVRYCCSLHLILERIKTSLIGLYICGLWLQFFFLIYIKI